MAAARPRIAIEKSVLHGICIRSQIQIVIHIEQMVVVGTIVKLIVGLGVLCVNADLTAAEGAVLTLPKLNSPIKTVIVEINGRCEVSHIAENCRVLVVLTDKVGVSLPGIHKRIKMPCSAS